MIFLIFVSLCSIWTISDGTQTGSRIIGGTPARVGQFRFAASIYITRPDGTYFCTGTLISNQWVLTAGQCVDGASMFIIRLGTTTLHGEDENSLRLSTEHYELHPDYNPLTLDSDVGLIRFRNEITFTTYIRAINQLGDTNLVNNVVVTIFGWGQTSDDVPGLTEDLHYVTGVTITNEECKVYYGSQVTDGMVCISGRYNEGTCLGDSGSPLVMYHRTGSMIHGGISSFYSGNGCESTEPSGYTRTHVYREWIRNVTGV